MSDIEKAQLVFLDAIERKTASQVEELKKVVKPLEAVITQLQKPKKWRFDIDRNSKTGRIEKVEAVQVE